MLNFLIVGSDQYLTKELIKNLGHDELLEINSDRKTQISNLLNLDSEDMIFLSKNNIDTYINLESDKYSKMPILISLDETKPLNIYTIKSLNELLVNNFQAKKKRTIAELEYIGYNFKFKGTQYLLDVILEVHKDDDIFLNNLQTTLYPIIAKKYGKTITDIKNCIISATDNMYAECSVEKLKKYFSLCSDEKPSIKRVIYTIANKIYQ